MRQLIIAALVFIASSCNNAEKNNIQSVLSDSTYYAITQDGVQTMVINNDSLIFFRTINKKNDLFSFDSSAYRIDVEKEKIVDLSVIDSNRVDIYLTMKDKFKKYFIVEDLSKNHISVLFEDSLFSSLKSARAYCKRTQSSAVRS